MADFGTQTQAIILQCQRLLLKQSKLDEAQLAHLKEELKKIRQSLKAELYNPKAFQMLGDLFLELDSKSGFVQAYSLAADSYAENNEPVKAAGICKIALQKDESNIQLMEKIGDLYASADKIHDAIESYEQILDVFESQNDWSNAFSIFHKIERLAEPTAAFLTKKGEIFLASGKVEPAAKAFWRSLELLSQEERWNDFVQVAERLLYIRPGDMETIQKLASVYLENGKLKRALQLLQRSLKLDPDNIETLELLLVAFEKLHDHKKILAILHKLASLLLQENQFEKAWKLYERILEKNPDDEMAQSIIEEYENQQRSVVENKLREVHTFLKHGMLDEAKESLEQIKVLEPENHFISHFDVEILLAENQRDLAAQRLLDLAQKIHSPEQALYYAQTILSIEGLLNYEIYGLASQMDEQLREWLSFIHGEKNFSSSDKFEMESSSSLSSFASLSLLAVQKLDGDLKTEDFEALLSQIQDDSDEFDHDFSEGSSGNFPVGTTSAEIEILIDDVDFPSLTGEKKLSPKKTTHSEKDSSK